MPFTLFLLALAVFVMGTSEFMLAGLLPAIAADLDVSIGEAGLLTSAFAVGMVVGAPLMAAFSRRWPPRTALLACLFLFAMSHLVGAVATAFPLLLAMRVAAALANAGFLAVALSTAAALVPADRKGRALGVLLSGTTIAMVAGVPAGALLGGVLGWRSTFWAVALLCLPAAVGILSGVPSRISWGGEATPALPTELGALRSPRLLLAMLLGALINAGTFAAFTFLAPVVTDVAGLDEAWLPVVLIGFGLGSFLGVLLAGRLSDRHPGLVLAVGGPLLAVGWVAAIVLAAEPIALGALVLLLGLLAFGVGSTIITRVLYAAAGAPTMGGSYATAALNVGAAVGPVLGAIVLGAGGGARAPFGIAAAVTVAALVLAVVFRRTLLRDQ